MSSDRTPLELEKVGDAYLIRLTADWSQPRPEQLEELRGRLVQLAAGDNPPRVAIEISALERLNAHLLGLLVQFQQRFRGQGGQIIIAGAPPQLQNLLKVTHLASVLTTQPTLEQALAILNSGQTRSTETAQTDQNAQQEPKDESTGQGQDPNQPRAGEHQG